MVIRKAIESDAVNMIELFVKLDSETSFMMMEPGERKLNVEDQAKRIKSFTSSDAKLMAVAEVDGDLVGFIVASSGMANRNRHSAYMVIGIQKAFWGQGIGSALNEFMEAWVDKAGIHRVEFTVMEGNSAARTLYKKYGYAEEGIKRDSLKVNGSYVNEIYMSKLFKTEQVQAMDAKKTAPLL